jgi:hypothetical protein
MQPIVIGRIAVIVTNVEAEHALHRFLKLRTRPQEVFHLLSREMSKSEA